MIWGGEFGRTPMAQGSDGRDHNPFGFTMWLAGGGIKGGTIHGATDDYGYHAVEDKVEVHDLHATMLHLLGMDHKKLTYRFSGRDMRLTDVHGEVVTAILALMEPGVSEEACSRTGRVLLADPICSVGGPGVRGPAGPVRLARSAFGVSSALAPGWWRRLATEWV